MDPQPREPRSASRIKPSFGRHARRGVDKIPSGLNGFDEITLGGLPKGRPTLVYGDPGVLLGFEESVDDLKQNVKALGTT
jgi:circadian clock protein KaiC